MNLVRGGFFDANLYGAILPQVERLPDGSRHIENAVPDIGASIIHTNSCDSPGGQVCNADHSQRGESYVFEVMGMQAPPWECLYRLLPSPYRRIGASWVLPPQRQHAR
jgi:hypothetical protein